MKPLDWIVLFGTLGFIVAYGVWKTRGSKTIESYLLGDKSLQWWVIGLSIMATQASAITFLSTPGQAYADGMRFVQFYFALPIAMVILSVSFVPLFHKLKVFTAYEFLERRFDLKTRILTSILFLVQRGLAAGLTIYAPAIILSTILGWQLEFTNLLIGVLVIIYTVSGGTKAVSQTQKQQMVVILTGMVIAFVIIVNKLPEDVSMNDALKVAGKLGKLDTVDFSFDIADRYNIWTGLTAALFLFMSYFGTDQSQVQRYLSGKSITEIRLGLLFNGLFKVPLQFFILLTGIMVFVFYQFEKSPIIFNKSAEEVIEQSEYREEMTHIREEYDENFLTKRDNIHELITALDADDASQVSLSKEAIERALEKEKDLREQAKALALQVDEDVEVNDKDYVFITFITDYLPVGLVGLLFAVIFSAAMSSTSSELNALASTTTVDLYRRCFNKDGSDEEYVRYSKIFTLIWGILAILFAMSANLFENLIQAVNILGSLFYGTILGVFLVAFYLKKIGSNAVFYAVILSEAIVIALHIANERGIVEIGYLWYNVVGCLLVILFSGLLAETFYKNENVANQ